MNQSSFVVKFMPAAERVYFEILERAGSDVTEDSIRMAMAHVLTGLGKQARDIGEPLFDFKKMEMRISRVIVPPLYVEYGVHFTKPNVYIRRVVLMRNPT